MEYELHKNHIIIPKRDVKRMNIPNLRYANIIVKRKYKTIEFLVKLLFRPYGTIEIVMPKFVRDSLEIADGDSFELVKIEQVKFITRPNQLITNNIVDLLYLIPQKMNNEKEIIICQRGDYLRLWSLKCNEVKIKRYSSIEVVGKLFGLMQAESAKYGNKFDFTNSLIGEHKDFIEMVKTISDVRKWICYAQLSPKTTEEEKVKIVKEFSDVTGVSLKNIIPVIDHEDGIHTFEICIYNKLFNEIFLGIMNNLRDYLANQNLNNEERNIAKFFLAKLLTGDGTVNIRRKRWKGFREVHVRLYSGNPQHRKDYIKIIENLGLKAFEMEGSKCIEINTNWSSLCELYKMNAFEGHEKNMRRIMVAVTDCFKTTQLLKLKIIGDSITPEKFAKLNNITTREAQRWLYHKMKEGYLVKSVKDPLIYSLTSKGVEILKFIYDLKEERMTEG